MAEKSVVITGSTRGLGLAMADAFLATGASVTISGRSIESVEAAKKKLGEKHPGERIRGGACDVSSFAQVEALYAVGSRRTGAVDIWVNNAGAGTKQRPLAELGAEELKTCLDTNLLGTVYGTRVALAGMLKGAGGQIVNLDGYGSTGQRRIGMAPYACTKAAVRSFTRSIELECAGTKVRICSLMPGPVATDMLYETQSSAGAEYFASVRKRYSIIGDTPEVIGAWAAQRILASTKNGDVISRLSPGLFLRFLQPKYRNRDLFTQFEKRA